MYLPGSFTARATVILRLAVVFVFGSYAGASAIPASKPVEAISSTATDVGGRGRLPIYLSEDWSAPLAKITRVVIVVHGLQRNAEAYFHHVEAARDAAGEAGANTMIIAPQFLTQQDAEAHHLSANILRWRNANWEGGFEAVAPAPVSSYTALDVIMLRLSDRRIFPYLKEVVVAGHSGGGQVVQRYAVVGHNAGSLDRQGVTVRFVVANPSSYVYFSKDRPVATTEACPRLNDWKYGLANRPPYAERSAPRALEQGYVDRNVIYLLGTSDNDPDHPELEKSCMAEAQGPTRLARGRAYAALMRARDGGTPKHVVWEVPGVGHSAGKMFNSACGRAALFGARGCAGPGSPR